MSGIAERRFVRQQGFRDASEASCAYQYPALMFQPRLVAGAVLLAGAGLASVAGWLAVARAIEGVVVAELGAPVVGRFCVGSYLYHEALVRVPRSPDFVELPPAARRDGRDAPG